MGEGQTQSPKDSVSIRHRDPDRPHCSSSLGAGTSATPVPTYPAVPEKLAVQETHQLHSLPVVLARESGKHAVLNQFTLQTPLLGTRVTFTDRHGRMGFSKK